MARQTDIRILRESIPVIIGAGITEKYYFSHIQSIFNYKFKIRPRYFVSESIEKMEKNIEKVLQEKSIAICVFDKDVAERDEKERKKLNTLLKKYSKKKNVIFCDSLPSIEYWFYLHYKNTNKIFKDSKAVEKALKKHINTYEKKKHFLEKEKWVSDLCSENKLEKAIQRAKKFGCECPSYSNVYKAFEKFKGTTR